MDPNEALNIIRDYVQQCWADGIPLGSAGQEDLFEHIVALDNWLSRGGFLPDAWRPVTGIEAIKSRGGF